MLSGSGKHPRIGTPPQATLAASGSRRPGSARVPVVASPLVILSGRRDREKEEGSMTAFRIANAPCSWGTLEFTAAGPQTIGAPQMLDGLRETGYSGTELGDWGYLPTDPPALCAELTRRGLTLVGAFVSVAFHDAGQHAAG